jgi:large subunit ribosomal protein L31
MQAGIHPDYQIVTITCACGESFQTRSTGGDFKTDLCSACHPFFTGTMKIVDSTGRVERFKNRYANFDYSKVKRRAK